MKKPPKSNEAPSHALPLTTAYLYLTDQCNLRCTHCWTVAKSSLGSQNHDYQIDIDSLKKFILCAKPLGLTQAKLTGGEPFLRTDTVDFIKFLSAQDVTVSIESNGTLLDEGIVKALREYSIDQISVSLDSSDEHEHESMRGVKGCFRKVVQVLPMLVENGMNTQVIMSLHKGNAQKIEPLAHMVSQLGVKSLKINPVMPTGRGKSFFQNAKNL
ncbi:MAG: radical SAM protein, partial [Syntrophales bacterium LBB04]|nr:radical SAM protein [Syntrophales bacterium LBB04]